MYEEWLNKSNQNASDKATLLDWIRHEYRDRFGNLESWIDEVNAIRGNDFKQEKAYDFRTMQKILSSGAGHLMHRQYSSEDLQITLGIIALSK